jgi:hypothetical protein
LLDTHEQKYFIGNFTCRFHLSNFPLGKWVVRPDYVKACTEAGEWLDEADYEWSTLEEGHDHTLATAAKRNRWRVSVDPESLFQGWQAGVVLGDPKHQNVYKR